MVSPLTAIVTLLVLTTIPTSSAKWFWPWAPPHYTVHITNELVNKETLYLVCRSTRGSRPEAYVNFGAEYAWMFKPHFLGKTLWQCYLAPDNQRHKFFTVYDDSTIRYFDNVYWVAKEDGVYSRDPETPADTLIYTWDFV
ncbi:S-protein homolog 1 [Linum perenne]